MNAEAVGRIPLIVKDLLSLLLFRAEEEYKGIDIGLSLPPLSLQLYRRKPLLIFQLPD